MVFYILFLYCYFFAETLFFICSKHVQNYSVKPFYDGYFKIFCQIILTSVPYCWCLLILFSLFQIFLVLSMMSDFCLKPECLEYYETQDLI